MKTSRMMFSTFVLFLGLAVAECSKLPENHDAEKEHTDVIRELTDAIHRLEARVAKRDEEMKVSTDSMTRLAEEVAKIKADIELQTEEFEKFKDQQGRVNSISSDVHIRVCTNK